MKKLVLLFVASLLFAFQFNTVIAASAEPSVSIAADLSGQHTLPGNLTTDEFLNLKPKEIAKRTGTKMNFLDRLAFRIVQKKMKKQMAKAERNGKKASSGLGVASLVLGSLSVLSFILLWTIPIFFLLALVFGLAGTITGAIARSNGDRGGAATAGFIMSLVAGGLALLLLILAVVLIASLL